MKLTPEPETETTAVFSIRRAGFCSKCRKTLRPGQKAVIHELQYFHFECYDALIDEAAGTQAGNFKETTMNYAEMFFTDPSITSEKLTPEVLEEIGRHKAKIIGAMLPYWKGLTGGCDAGVLAIELEQMTPDFVRALAQALAADPLTRAAASLQMVLDPKKPAADDNSFDADFVEDDNGESADQLDDEARKRIEDAED